MGGTVMHLFMFLPKMPNHISLREPGLIDRCISTPLIRLIANMLCGSMILYVLLLSDSFGKTDEREPLTNAVRSDSAVIGGKPFLVVASRRK